MGRPRKEKKEYERLPLGHWSDFLGSNYNRGIQSVKPVFAMLLGNYRRLVRDDGNQQERLVTYDQDYVFDYYCRDFLERLGFIGDDGSVEEERVNDFMTDLIDYAKKRKDGAKERELIEKAREMAEQFPHMTEEQWLEVLTQKK